MASVVSTQKPLDQFISKLSDRDQIQEAAMVKKLGMAFLEQYCDEVAGKGITVKNIQAAFKNIYQIQLDDKIIKNYLELRGLENSNKDGMEDETWVKLNSESWGRVKALDELAKSVLPKPDHSLDIFDKNPQLHGKFLVTTNLHQLVCEGDNQKLAKFLEKIKKPGITHDSNGLLTIVPDKNGVTYIEIMNIKDTEGRTPYDLACFMMHCRMGNASVWETTMGIIKGNGGKPGTSCPKAMTAFEFWKYHNSLKQNNCDSWSMIQEICVPK